MVNSRLCETARVAFFFARLPDKCAKKIETFEILKSVKKMRLQDP